VAFVLHDVFGLPFDTIAETVGRPVAPAVSSPAARGKFTAAHRS